jgi:hypothetical protein
MLWWTLRNLIRTEVFGDSPQVTHQMTCVKSLNTPSLFD